MYKKITMKNTNTLYKKQCGNQGEELATQYLLENGYQIVKRNFKFGREGEIDIIANHNNTLVFIEVKTRTNHSFGDPIEQISQRKRKNWYHAAKGFLYVNKISNQECRFDAIIIDLSKDAKEQILHIQNAM